MRQVLLTPRLRLREFDEADADFIVSLLNDADFIRYIADKNVRNAEDARLYLRDGPLASYARNGFGLWCVERLSDGVPVGMCGLIRRDALDDVDIGYALLPEFCGQGYAAEATRAVLDTAVRQHGLHRVIAVVNPDNHDSSRMLEKLGFHFEKMVKLAADEPDIRQFAIALSPGVD